jgi:DNA (cytosine-5)-methyltransferase 1
MLPTKRQLPGKTVARANSIAKFRGIDLFSGAGGSSCGARAAGIEMVAAFDAWELAGKVYADNFSNATFHHGMLEDADPVKLARSLGPIDLILASPECTNHSPAKGKGPRCEKSKDTAFQVVRFAQALKPRWVIVENVVSMRNWSRYSEFVGQLESLGYSVRQQILNSKDFGVPQSRRRLFITCDLQAKPRPIAHRRRKLASAADAIDQNGTYKYTPLRTDTRATATLQRAERAIAALGDKKPFLIVYYGSDHAGGWQRIEAPLRTITTLDRFAFVKREAGEHVMRMLQVPELQIAMGMPRRYKLRYGTRRDRIRMMGNAVCAPVMRAVVHTLTS